MLLAVTIRLSMGTLCALSAFERGLRMNISVCVGSSCHLRGSYTIIELMKSSLERYGLTEKVNLGAAFCLGKCTEGVSIRFDDEIVSGVSAENFDQVFSEHVLKPLGL